VRNPRRAQRGYYRSATELIPTIAIFSKVDNTYSFLLLYYSFASLPRLRDIILHHSSFSDVLFVFNILYFQKLFFYFTLLTLYFFRFHLLCPLSFHHHHHFRHLLTVSISKKYPDTYITFTK
jgi:hypothetical protein